MIVKRFKEFSLLEKLGLSIPSVCYADSIYESALNMLLVSIALNKNEANLNYIIEPDKFINCINNKKDYLDFPVVKIQIDLNIKVDKRLNEEEIKHAIGGLAYRFGNKNWKYYSKKVKSEIEDLDFGIIPHMGLDIFISENYKIKDNKTFEDDLKEVIWHELNHLYEFYNRIKIGKGPLWSRMPKLSISYSDKNKWGIPNKIYNYWSENFVFLFYLSEPYEVNAQVQEASYFAIKYGMDELRKTKAWEYSKIMADFNPNDFIEKLDSLIKEYIDENPEEKTALYSGVLSKPIKERLKSMWLSIYKKTVDELKETPKIDINKLEKSNCDFFVKYMTKKLINPAGNKMISKLAKLYDISKK